MENLPNPHDRLFKEIWSSTEVVKDFIRYYMPKDVSALIDTEQTEICKDSFVREDLKEYYSDILYRVMLNSGQQGYLYFLFEHKSYPDKYVPLQLLGYGTDIWRLHLKQETGRTKHLPVIIPILIYHGREKWTRRTDFSHLFGKISDTLAVYVPDFRFDLCDLSAYSDDQIKGNVLLKVLFLLFKYVYHPGFQEKLPQIFSLFRELLEKDTGMQYLETVMRYVLAASEITLDKLKTAVESGLSEKGETVTMTTAEKLINEGIQKGIQQGIQQGIIEAIELGLGIRFGAYGLKLMPAILKITDFGKLRAIKEALKIAGNISEVEAMI